ncbi:hypothetical protein E2C01_010640 [Portunus trituberculatus]|uniref:Uncharacterized protein n=1 Tax=Portunus trituberculatus TaxID=210409 RepID=A0A5B7D8Z7_PORTR|nr:hypothetical protein [Portunus trituberculatus]
MNTRVSEPPAPLVFIKQRAGSSETGIRYSSAALLEYLSLRFLPTTSSQGANYIQKFPVAMCDVFRLKGLSR